MTHSFEHHVKEFEMQPGFPVPGTLHIGIPQAWLSLHLQNKITHNESDCLSKSRQEYFNLPHDTFMIKGLQITCVVCSVSKYHHVPHLVLVLTTLERQVVTASDL